MILQHLGKSPAIDRDAFVAPDATVCGDVTIGQGARVMHGARIVAEGGRIVIGRDTIVMQNAVVRSTETHDCAIGSNVLIGPTAHVVGSTVEDRVFLATGTSIFHGSRLGEGSVVRIHGVVHVNTVLETAATVPIGWVAVGDPAQLFSTDRHDALWDVQKTLDFAATAYGIDGPLQDGMVSATSRVSRRLDSHKADTVID